MYASAHYRHARKTSERPVLITAPTDAVVTLDDFKAQMRDPGDDDDFLQAVLDAAVAQIDPAGGGWLERALRTQTWELRLDRFPAHEIRLPYPPLIAITSVIYTDTGGTTQTLAATTGYRVIDGGRSGKSFLRPPYNGCWPVSRCDSDAVKIRYTCGYALTPSDSMPAPIKQAVLLMGRALYDIGKRDMTLSQDTVVGVRSRSYAVTAEAAQLARQAAENLLSTYRVWG
jgi:uncharacterized phiE125 gp8 family phage protein